MSQTTSSDLNGYVLAVGRDNDLCLRHLFRWQEFFEVFWVAWLPALFAFGFLLGCGFGCRRGIGRGRQRRVAGMDVETDFEIGQAIAKLTVFRFEVGDATLEFLAIRTIGLFHNDNDTIENPSASWTNSLTLNGYKKCAQLQYLFPVAEPSWRHRGGYRTD